MRRMETDFYNAFLQALPREKMLPTIHVRLDYQDNLLAQHIQRMIMTTEMLNVVFVTDEEETPDIEALPESQKSSWPLLLIQPVVVLMFLRRINYQAEDGMATGHTLYPTYKLFTQKVLRHVGLSFDEQTATLRAIVLRYRRLMPECLDAEANFAMGVLMTDAILHGNMMDHATPALRDMYETVFGNVATTYREFFATRQTVAFFEGNHDVSLNNVQRIRLFVFLGVWITRLQSSRTIDKNEAISNIFESTIGHDDELKMPYHIATNHLAADRVLLNERLTGSGVSLGHNMQLTGNESTIRIMMYRVLADIVESEADLARYFPEHILVLTRFGIVNTAALKFEEKGGLVSWTPGYQVNIMRLEYFYTIESHALAMLVQGISGEPVSSATMAERLVR
ncbi:hypothetical protein H7R52_04010 [Weissella confusa]|uniref:Mga helix-turn-helix domain-containing protein n=1 Tax=Weissella confusa TaxID=1583 RepID=A0A923NG21_WEICO|nr:hypothetical protein [Weissella confusa]